ncbi:MAG: hypothetical protein R3213_06245 [Flavobacteriaceae bacterium]|nr:hypothetical protein [Flavobacteriaceae bacterium]
MIGDRLQYFSAYKPISNYVISLIKSEKIPNSKFVISVGGESGCGKTSLAYSLKTDIETLSDYQGIIFHQDDYFNLPPYDNHEARLQDISRVGIQEVNLKLLDLHLQNFKQKQLHIEKPLVNYVENSLVTEKVDLENVDFCIVEGTYSTLLKAPDYKIFMKMDYLQSKSKRMERNRDRMGEFIEEVLNIEHKIIQPHYSKADLIIEPDLKLTFNT